MEERSEPTVQVMNEEMIENGDRFGLPVERERRYWWNVARRAEGEDKYNLKAREG